MATKGDAGNAQAAPAPAPAPAALASQHEQDAHEQKQEQEQEQRQQQRQRRRPRVLLGCTGSVASIKAAQLVGALNAVADVRIVATAAARRFFDVEDLPLDDPKESNILGDEDEWRAWRAVGDPVLHIDLRRWADVFLIAPLSANTLSKMASGACDNLLTCVVRAWDFRDEEKRMLLAPAMNTCMWESPFTRRHLDVLLELGGGGGAGIGGCLHGQTVRGGGGRDSCAAGTVSVVDPVEKVLACGDIGNGAMASVDTIVAAVARQAAQLTLDADS